MSIFKREAKPVPFNVGDQVWYSPNDYAEDNVRLATFQGTAGRNRYVVRLQTGGLKSVWADDVYPIPVGLTKETE